MSGNQLKRMIQRIQSIFLFIAALATGYAAFDPPLWEFKTDLLIPYGLATVFYSYIAVTAIAFISIFIYKNRKVQMNLIRLDIVLDIVLLGFLVYWFLNLPGENIFSEKGIGLIYPLISIVFLVLAHKAIKRDDNLVKSVDRLR